MAALQKKDGWTLVSAYFNLTKRPDANSAVRSLEHYRNSWAETFKLNRNLVIYSDDKSLCELFKREREAAGFKDKTIVYFLPWEDVRVTKYYDRIVENRRKNPDTCQDPRNTPSYYLLCMARYELLKLVMAENPFGSTHFAWINICISRMGLSNVRHLDEALDLYREKFSTAYIDYIPKSLTLDLGKYYRPARCGMCSGFFTASKDYLTKVCDLVLEMFVRVLNAGYGHADEQLFTLVYFEHPELFHFYFGDYYQMITNYAHIYENPDVTINLLMPKAYAAGNYDVAYSASWEAKRIALNTTQHLNVLKTLFESAWYLGDCWAPLPVTTAASTAAVKEKAAVSKKCRETCLEVVRHFMYQSQFNPIFLQAVRQQAATYLRMTDYAVALAPSKSVIGVNKPGFAKTFPRALLSLCHDDEGARVFLFDPTYEVTHKSFVLANPVERPPSLPFHGCGFTHVIS